MRTILLLAALLSGLASAETDWLAAGDQAFAKKDWGAAASAYGEVVKTSDQDARAWFRLGFALHAAKRFDEAIDAHRHASAFPETKAHALYNLACAYGMKGDRDTALANLEAAVDAGFLTRTEIEKDKDLAILVGEAKFRELARRANVYRHFDFWVGQWEVFDPAGKQVGSNIITLSEQGKVITENWTNMQGQTGTSMNFFDPADSKWHQIWVDPGGTVIRFSSAWSNGAMSFLGVSTDARGVATPTRMSFTPREDGTVRQLFEQSADKGATWTVAFDGIYRPRPGR